MEENGTELKSKLKSQIEGILAHDVKRKKLVNEVLQTKDSLDPELIYVKVQNKLIKIEDFEDVKNIQSEQFLNLDD